MEDQIKMGYLKKNIQINDKEITWKRKVLMYGEHKKMKRSSYEVHTNKK
jgi:hypothetical protein